jgi:phosphopantothenoylcysteine synthetase/decarboxylase
MRRAGSFAAPQPIAERPAMAQPPAPAQPMGPEPALEISEEVRQAAKDLDILKAQAAKGGTRPETTQEMDQRRTEIIRQVMADNPLAAETIYTALMGKTAEPPKLDAESRKTIGFADRMNNAEIELASVLKDFNPAGTFQGLAAAMPNFLKKGNRQKYEALALDWITANLRQESGAAIGEKEYENDFKKYFPQPGDSAETVELKQSLREQAVSSKVGPIQSMFPSVNIMGMAGEPSPATSRMSFNPSTKTIQ